MPKNAFGVRFYSSHLNWKGYRYKRKKNLFYVSITVVRGICYNIKFCIAKLQEALSLF